MRPKSKYRKILPEAFEIAHKLCFVIHDIMVQMIKSGEEGQFFTTTITMNDDDYSSLEKTDDVFTWLENKERLRDRAQVVKNFVFPAVLSDMMHSVFACLENSRKAKLGISYMLIRKPLQENLYLIESIVLDELDFSNKLAADPLKLRPKNTGDVENHRKRIQKVLDVIGETSRLDASYIAQLRYDKNEYDSFDGVCNKAMHLFTEHKAIRTENLNINFIFSDSYSKNTQWHYLYSRLPYLLFYTHQITEHIIATIAPTKQEYLNDIQRRISALTILWWKSVDGHYKCDQLNTFVQETQVWLNDHCNSSGYRHPTESDLLRMSDTGAYPKEKLWSVKIRNLKYKLQAVLNRRTAGN